MIERRPYQDRAIAGVHEKWNGGARSVLLVSPTGSGKTHMGDLLVGAARTLWVAHTRELVDQAAEKLRQTRGVSGVGVVMPGVHETPGAPVQVGTVQTLVARGYRLDQTELVVLDEAQHYMAEQWREMADALPDARLLGLTATPQRRDGEPLGDIFQEIVVAAQYSELLAGGWIVPVRVYQPPKNLDNDLALDPLEAWAQFSEGSRTFAFVPLVEKAYDLAERLRAHSVLAQCVEAETALRERREHLAGFKAGKIVVLSNVFALTEGVDVPEAQTALLARKFGFVGGYLQAVGRVLRPAPGKEYAIIIDLCGSSIVHGLPTQDRAYSLKGRPISGGEPFGGGSGGGEPEPQQVLGTGLRLVTPMPAVKPQVAQLNPIAEAERRAEFKRLLALARQHRMRDGFASAKYREKFGEWPREEWR